MSAARVVSNHPYEAGQDAELERWPGVTWSREIKGKHYALVVTFGGVSRFVIYPSTPGDKVRGLLNHLRDVRAELSALGAVRRVPIKAIRPHRERNRTEPRRIEFTDRCQGGPKRDPWAALATIQISEPVAPTPPWWRRLLAWMRITHSERTASGDARPKGRKTGSTR